MEILDFCRFTITSLEFNVIKNKQKIYNIYITLELEQCQPDTIVFIGQKVV